MHIPEMHESVGQFIIGREEAGDVFRTKEDPPGAVRAFKILSLDPLQVGQAHGSGFRTVNRIPGKFLGKGLGEGFPTISGTSDASFQKTHSSIHVG